MSLIIPPGFGNAAFVFTTSAGTGPIVTTCGFDISSYGGDFVSAANDMKGTYAGIFGATTAAELTLDRVTLTVGQDGPGGSVDSDTVPLPMGRSGVQVPVSMSPIARKVTNELGRRGRGRMFLPGLLNNSEVTEDGSVVPARRDAIQLLLNDWMDWLMGVDPPGIDLPPVLFHSQAPADPTPITGFAVSDLVGWVRGRIR